MIKTTPNPYRHDKKLHLQANIQSCKRTRTRRPTTDIPRSNILHFAKYCDDLTRVPYLAPIRVTEILIAYPPTVSNSRSDRTPEVTRRPRRRQDGAIDGGPDPKLALVPQPAEGEGAGPARCVFGKDRCYQEPELISSFFFLFFRHILGHRIPTIENLGVAGVRLFLSPSFPCAC